jgi:putative acetyltransferase
VTIRREEAGDRAGVYAVLVAAFPTDAEAKLVELLRQDGDAEIALVAIVDGKVAGQVMFSPMRGPLRALGLGPVAVEPARQRAGIGSELIRAGLALAEAGGWEAVFVLGEEKYYGRFGFETALAAGFTSPYAGPHFMAFGFGRPWPRLTGRIDYAPAFAALG